MIKRRYFVLCFLILLGCSKKISKDQIIGNWWSIEEDSTYSEVYVNGAEWVINHESYGPIGYQYKLTDDSLFISDSMNSRLRIWKIVRSSSSSLVIKSNMAERKLYKFKLNNSYFGALNDSVAYDNFEQEFIYRYLIRK
jgi:hypothetical protein